jgi:hypothetical protein
LRIKNSRTGALQNYSSKVSRAIPAAKDNSTTIVIAINSWIIALAID